LAQIPDNRRIREMPALDRHPNPHLATLAADLHEIIGRTEAIVSPLTPEQRSRPSESGGWSVDQVLEHLVISNASYLTRMRRLVDRHQDDPVRPGTPPWEPTFVGRLLVRSLDPSSVRRLPAPKVSRPSAVVRPGVLERFIDGMREAMSLAQRAESLDLNALRMSSPFARVLKLNLGDAFAIIVVHARRHLRQIENLIPQVA
jgi:hypothetical protein